ncbi:MAG TPA: hypothetical protein VNH16_25095 [Burkholderiales bacterium]|jgi:hypothetical protein|nr:hypothetical protein [Burkholderiales bacterium]
MPKALSAASRKKAIRAWQKKLDYLVVQQANVADPQMQFKVSEDIRSAEAQIRKLGATPGASSGSAHGHTWLESLFSATLCSRISQAVRPHATHSLVSMLRKRVSGDAALLIKAGRFLVERQLLATAQTPYCELTGEREAFFPDGNLQLWDAVEKREYLRPSHALNPGQFLERTVERAPDWYQYFDALRESTEPRLAPEEIQTLHAIEVRGKGGAIAPQYLVAGLMAYFHDDWWPVIRGYTSVGDKAGLLERLKASQWICWLVWGPSIPLCRCDQWRPVFAYQFGYGDENNSLPVYFKRELAPLRKLLADRKYGDRRAVQMRTVSGRLSWGPFAFSSPASFAPAQGRLVTPPPPTPDRANEHPANGLLLNLEEAEPRDGDPTQPAYFTAYVWLMFWVGKTRPQGDAPVRRLNEEPLPAPTDASANRHRISAERLWEDLLPIFVHANIFDPVVLKFQKGMLIENALHLLRQTWVSEKRGIEFHLVCASDYSGCGNEIEFAAPPGQSLVELLRERLRELQGSDPEFAGSINLPDPKETLKTRSEEFRWFFSACRLPDMVGGYYRFLRDKVSE